jgi:cell division protein ZapA (FtsZ GTPase activity inhibitor)
MFAEDSIGVRIEIMGKQHQFSCSAEQVEGLKQAAENLTAMCDDIKKQKGMGGSERALLVASINLSYSLLMANNEIKQYKQGHDTLIASLKSAL